MGKHEVRFFNTTGPCNPDDHYMLPPEERLVGTHLHRYIIPVSSAIIIPGAVVLFLLQGIESWKTHLQAGKQNGKE